MNTSTGSLRHGSTIILFDEKFSTHEVVRIFKKLPLFRVFQEQTIDRRRNKTERQQKDNKKKKTNWNKEYEAPLRTYFTVHRCSQENILWKAGHRLCVPKQRSDDTPQTESPQSVTQNKVTHCAARRCCATGVQSHPRTQAHRTRRWSIVFPFVQSVSPSFDRNPPFQRIISILQSGPSIPAVYSGLWSNPDPLYLHPSINLDPPITANLDPPVRPRFNLDPPVQAIGFAHASICALHFFCPCFNPGPPIPNPDPSRVVFLGGEISLRGNQNKSRIIFLIFYYWKKCSKFATFEGENLKLPYLGNTFLKKNSNSLTCSQIWLIPFVNDCHSTYLTKII